MTEAVPQYTTTPTKSSRTPPSPLAVNKIDNFQMGSSNKDLVELGSTEDGDTEAVTKEEEWITKRKTELTTTKQIETRVKRQVVLEDGKVVEDSGPIVSTNTTEDTDKQETETTERRDLGNPEAANGHHAILYNHPGDTLAEKTIAENLTDLASRGGNSFSGKLVQRIVPRPADGLVREIDEKRVVSREEIKELLETEDVRHLGDFSDEAYVKAVNSGADNLKIALYAPDNQKKLASIGPRIVHQSTKAHKTVDTEDINQKSLAQEDGTLITEKKKTTEHEEIYDEDLPNRDDNSTGSREKINIVESSQRYLKQRDEENVEYLADGKIIAKEMRYAAETEQMERDGPPEGPGDWDSLSDRIKKSRARPKTLLQQQREAALTAERKDALTKRPLDFDYEEDTRKGETMKWLESHFGSESSTSTESREDDPEIEPTKKTYFNVTIKSNPTAASSAIKPIPNGINGNLSSPSKVIMPDRDTYDDKTKYFQGISNWSDRKESTPKHLASKAFRDELQGTLERNRMRHRQNAALHKNETYVSKEDIIQQKRQYNNDGSRSDVRKESRDYSDDMKTIRAQKEDLGYLSGSRTDLRYRRDSNDEFDRRNRRNSGHLKREDSGYVKDSREDLRSSVLRDIEDEKLASSDKYKSSLIQRDDSAYVSSSTYFTEPRLPKTPQLHTPDSGIRSPSPDQPSRPSVPQRRRAIEKKIRQQTSYSPSSADAFRQEPPPDYSPPPRSRSTSPQVHILPTSAALGAHSTADLLNGYTRKLNQRTRFASESSSASQHNIAHTLSKHSTLRPSMATQTTQTSPPKQSTTKVGTAIGNSLRKLVGKIRSASAERKFRMKSKSKSQERTPSPPLISEGGKSVHGPGSTYQQYNVIDSHIGGHPAVTSLTAQTTTSTSTTGISHHRSSASTSAPLHHNRESSVVSSSTTVGRDRQTSATHQNGDRRGSSDLDMTANPKQRYYLGEDPYGGSLFGKENKYDGRMSDQRDAVGGPLAGIGSEARQHHRPRREGSSDDYRELFVQRNLTSSTLGRYQKSNNRMLGSTPNLEHDYRTTSQTLPRKLEHRKPAHHSSTINVSIVNQVKPTQNTGPAKPARTYKSLNRSKSFNVHGMNGTNDPSPIYIEKLTKNNYTSNMYKSNPHLHHYHNESATGGQLKSPSIVSLISRSQKDLTKMDDERKYQNYLPDRKYSSQNTNVGGSHEKRNLFVKGLHEQAPELSRILHGRAGEEPGASVFPAQRNVFSGGNHKYPNVTNQRDPPSSLGSRSPIEINKDTASIVRRGSSSTEDNYSETFKYQTRSDDPKRPMVTNTVQSFSKQTVPTRDGRGMETIHSQEKRSVMSSRYRGEPMSNLKYIEDQKRRGSGSTIIEVRRK